jgi:hypothetical protein
VIIHTSIDFLLGRNCPFGIFTSPKDISATDFGLIAFGPLISNTASSGVCS